MNSSMSLPATGANPFQPPAYLNSGSNPLSMLGGATGVAGIGGILGGLFEGSRNIPNPSDAASSYFNQIPGTIKPYYDPYINAGRQSLGSLQDQYSQLLNNPGGKLNQIGQGFQQSPGFNWQVGQATNAANRAAAAGGMLGSPMEQQQLATTVNGLANQDYYDWLNHATNLYGQGLQGQQGMSQMGYNASNDLAQNLASGLMNQGMLAYGGAVNQNQQQGTQSGNMMNDIIGGAATLALL